MYSEYGQDDYLIENIFKQKWDLKFCEFGALDGVYHSNTYALEKFYDWTGLIIEPAFDEFIKAQRNRKCLVFNTLIADKFGAHDYMKISGEKRGWSGIIDKMESEHKERIYSIGAEKKEIQSRMAMPISFLLTMCGFKKINYMSIDVEGAELSILKTFPFDLHKVDCFTVENNFDNREIPDLMKANNYKFIKKIGADEIYVLQSGIFNAE